MEILFPSFIFLILLNSSCHLNEKKVDTYDNLKKDLKEIEIEKTTLHADADEFETEVNNGGLNQFFFNSSGKIVLKLCDILKNQIIQKMQPFLKKLWT